MASKDTQLNIIVNAQNNTASGFASLKKQLDITKVSVDGISSAMKTVGTGGVVALTGLTAFFAKSVQSYGQTQLAIAKVDATLKAMGKTADGAKERILEASKATIRLGFDDEITAVSITKLFQRTGDLNEAIRLNALAMDLSRAKSVDLEQASQMISLVMSGNARALKEYGIVLDETKTPMEALAQLQGMVAGQAESATSSITIQNQVLKESFSNLQDEIGERLVPMLSMLIGIVTPYIEKLTEWIDKNPELTKQLFLAGTALTAIVAIMLPLGFILPTIVSFITALATGFGLVAVALGTTAMPLLGIIALLGIIGFTAYKIAQQWQDAWDVITIAVADTANNIQVIIEGIMNYIIDSVNWLINKVNTLISKLESVPILGKKFKDIKISTIDPFQMERFDTGAIYNNMMNRPASKTLGDTILNITGNTFMSDEDSAEKIGDMIMSRLKLSNSL